jgi:hypothetical protein
MQKSGGLEYMDTIREQVHKKETGHQSKLNSIVEIIQYFQ